MSNRLKPGINHIEFWVSDLRQSMNFYNSFLPLIGWKKISDVSFSTENMVIYFQEMKEIKKLRSLGVRHLCFQAVEKGQVEEVCSAMVAQQANIIRGPLLMPYSKEYYTLDFFDPDGQVIEVAHTPFANMG
ncbi:MAG: VOC family protein [Pedobacter sp.]|uniref:VOC family protein n=1 Tax=Pedobacter sp. TaxID=1411316 RepID=UPI0033956AF8